MTLWTVFTDVCLMGMVFLAGQILRAKVKFSKVPDTACADCRVPGSDFRAQRISAYPILQQPGYLCQRFNRCNICSHGYRR